ncbi:serine acetyltransferase [Herbaspirillum sp. SJZ099]|uniref:serine acetyltransferase n=1 Tax=Herbaspirillum sp. SJZ099 TaxID=2572916 RepID=UPI0011AA5239|nr:serine acetyltransferase [Herbaspirillum sp. SJZ099]
MNTRIRSSLTSKQLAQLAAHQVNNLHPDGEKIEPADLSTAAPQALSRLEHCFSHIGNKYFFDGQQAIFDHLHGDQYAMWLYFLASELHESGGPTSICKKLFLLNKTLHGCDIFYEVKLPSVFLLVHPLGTVLGRGHYADFLLVYQRCGVGSNHDAYPTLGEHVSLRPGSSVLGRCSVGNNCAIATESLLLDQELPPDSVYIGNPRDHLIRPKSAKESIWRT